MSESEVEYGLAIDSGYKANVVRIGNNPLDPNEFYSKRDYPDVEITRPQYPESLELVHKKCLVTANGYVQETEYYDNRLFIRNLTSDLLHSKSNHLGLISFNSMDNDLIKTKITNDMIYKEDEFPLYNKVIISFPNEVKDGFLILAGYIVTEADGIFYRISDRSFVIRIDRLDYLERLYELNRYTEIWKKLNVEVSSVNPSLLKIEDVYSDNTIRNLLTLNNTFFVETPGYSVEFDKVYLERTTFPGSFRTEVKPTMPLITGYGKFIEYKHRKASGRKYVVNTTDAYVNNHLFTKSRREHGKLVNDHRIVGDTYRLTTAFFLKITLTKK